MGTVAAGRIGLRVLQRLKPFDVHLHYYDKFRLDKSIEKDLNVTYHPNVESLVKVCDVVTINCPLHPETEHMFDKKMLSLMKKGSYIVNTARGKIMDRDALVNAVKSNHIQGYAGDVWYPQVRIIMVVCWRASSEFDSSCLASGKRSSMAFNASACNDTALFRHNP